MVFNSGIIKGHYDGKIVEVLLNFQEPQSIPRFLKNLTEAVEK